jgi:hypothetical protein
VEVVNRGMFLVAVLGSAADQRVDIIGILLRKGVCIWVIWARE